MARVATIALVLLTLATTTFEFAEARPPCQARGARTLLANGEVRVYRLHGEIFACHRRTGRRTGVGTVYFDSGSSSGASGVTILRLAGHFVGAASVLQDCCGRFAGVEIRNVRTGRRVYSFPAGGGSRASTDADVTDLVLRPNGSAAWMEGFGGPAEHQPPTRFVVRKADTREAAILDRGTGIAGDSLTLRGRTVAWEHDGQRRTAELR